MPAEPAPTAASNDARNLRVIPGERDPSKTFADPFIACTTCGVRVYWSLPDGSNDPCGHRGYDRQVKSPTGVTYTEHVEAWKTLCPSWGPVDGCTCEATFGEVGHGVPK